MVKLERPCPLVPLLSWHQLDRDRKPGEAFRMVRVNQEADFICAWLRPPPRGEEGKSYLLLVQALAVGQIKQVSCLDVHSLCGTRGPKHRRSELRIKASPATLIDAQPPCRLVLRGRSKPRP